MSNSRFSIEPSSGTYNSAKLLYVSSSKYEGEWQSIRHTHYFSEFFYITSGSGKFIVDGNSFNVSVNDLIIINPNIEHAETSIDLLPLEYIVLGVEGISFDFNDRDFTPSYSVASLSKGSDKILATIKMLLLEAESQEKGYASACDGILKILLVQMMRFKDYTLKSALPQKLSKECALVKRYIDSDFADEITLDILASKAHLNKYYLVHLFTKSYGSSPINYLLERRIVAAKDLLEGTNYSISHISQSVGFSSQSYFSQVFKRISNQTPADYRKKLRLK